MKTKVLTYLFLLSIVSSCFVQKKKSIEHQEIADVITTMYQTISGDTLTERDWDLFISLFHKNAELNYTTKIKKDSMLIKSLTPKEYAEMGASSFKKYNFNEIELHRVTEVFGNVAHVFSTYQTTYESNSFKKVKKGINSIQLIYNGKKWLITSITWSDGTKENPVPSIYLPK